MRLVANAIAPGAALAEWKTIVSPGCAKGDHCGVASPEQDRGLGEPGRAETVGQHMVAGAYPLAAIIETWMR